MTNSRRARRVSASDVVTWAIFVTAALAIARLAFEGRHYYALSLAARREHALHDALRPSGAVGHSLGIAGTAMMLTNLLYLVRRRLARVEALGSMRAWLRWHVFSGVAGPALVALHSALTLRTWPAVVSSASLLVVVVTGLAGRYLYGLVPRALNGSLRDIEEVRADLDHALMLLRATGAAGRAAVDAFETVSARDRRLGGSDVLGALRARWGAVALERSVGRAARAAAATPDEVRVALARLHRVSLLHLRAEALLVLQGAASTWRALHRSLALVMLVAASLHVTIAVYLGYGF